MTYKHVCIDHQRDFAPPGQPRTTGIVSASRANYVLPALPN
jgi:hypothetical protein